MINARAALLLGTCLLLACGDRGDHHVASDAAPVARTMSPMPTDTAWIRGGSKDDLPLVYPDYMGHDGTRVYVSDQVTHAVTAFDQATGKTAWVTNPNTSVLKNPAAMSGLPGGGVAVIDGASQGLVLLSAKGAVARVVPLNEAATARQVCALSDSAFLLAVPRTRFPLVMIDVNGRTLSRQDLPWLEARELTPMQTQVLMTSAGDGQCAVALAYGGGLALVGQEGAAWRSPYVEGTPLPVLKVTKEERAGVERVSSKVVASHVSVLDIAASDSTIEVAFDGETPDRGKLVDAYSLKTGKYVMTWKSDRRVVGFQETPTRIFALTGWKGYPALVALARHFSHVTSAPRPIADAANR